ncbi:hypothetical protein BCR43DRAFT_410413, partial [Syncephalastrum racemosum]
PWTRQDVADAIAQLPSRKTPGIDHIRAEMLKPLCPLLARVLDNLFRLCWLASWTPSFWRAAQVVPIHKAGSRSDPANFRPISLTSVFRKVFE